MRVIVTGGGTGGHIYPAIAIADKIKEKNPDAEILYVGNEEGLEKDIVPKTGYPMEMVEARWLDRGNLKTLFRTGRRVLIGIADSRRVLKKFKPDMVIGTGGYVCLPVIIAAHTLGIKSYIHEQNAYPGMANQILERFVDKIFLGFPEAGKHFKSPEKLVNAGNPVRKSFFELKKDAARRELGLPEDDFIIMSFGGSLGSEKMNEVAFELMDAVNGHEKVMMIFGTGKWYYEDVHEKIKSRNIEIRDNILIKDYIDNMDKYLAACDLVISRAGALSVAETTVCGKACILIPSPNVTANHQYHNAKAVADHGGAVLLEEKDLTPELLIEEVFKIKNNPELFEKMSKACRECAPDHALDIIYDTVTGK